ncbi:MAG TPA: HlyD family efflux transporter periplasmic adaptor subunit [Bacteroidales bacterium]|nr:HlyD family efflux transporter periplasmic adaptor subunit [Bacteroidales bacterium]HPS72597.1 HlyD family efflux transporter periplasmic adaptor subunit [Bacteroidales bacterium]
MKIIKITFGIIIMMVLATSCKEERQFDATGSFEADEYIISAEGMGTIKMLQIEEGKTIQENEIIGYIDTIQLHLKREQIDAQIKAVLSRKPNIAVQIASLEEQLNGVKKEQQRFTRLVQNEAATPKQLDDINTQYQVLKKQLDALYSSLEINAEGLSNESVPLRIQKEQLDDQINKCIIVNPIKGTILSQYAKVNEIATTGKPLYKIADLSNIILRVYISGDQLSKVKLNQKVKVFTDAGDGKFKETEGTITWISDKSEFTPKTIQTKNERANLVYAIKVKVVNDGSYKIGMYGEINF